MRNTPDYTSRRGMSGAERAVHTLLIMGTCGLWYPVYLARKAQANRVTRTHGRSA